MKPLFSILLICSIGLTQELTVDGNLNVTGNIQNQTIDSLQQVIAGLQAQITALQSNGSWETRAFDFFYNNDIHNDYELSIQELTGLNLDYAEVRLLNVYDLIWDANSNYTGGTTFSVKAVLSSYGQHYSGSRLYVSYAANYGSPHFMDVVNGPGANSMLINPEYQNISIGGESHSNYAGLSFGVTFLVTADFANAPTDQAPAPPQNSRTAP